jgi:hypothetical protein
MKLMAAPPSMSILEIGTRELSQQHEHHVDVHANQWWRPILDQQRLIVIQLVHVIVGDHGCRDIILLLHPPLLLCREHKPNSVEMLISFLLGHVLPQLLCSLLLDPPSLAVRES